MCGVTAFLLEKPHDITHYGTPKTSQLRLSERWPHGRSSAFLCSLKVGFGPCIVILTECTEGFGVGGVGTVSGPTAQHIVSMAPVPPD